MDDSYSDGGVYKLLGDAYAGKGDKDNAKSNYEKAATDYPGTQAAYSAQSALDAMGSDGTSEILPVEQAPRTIKYKRHKEK